MRSSRSLCEQNFCLKKGQPTDPQLDHKSSGKNASNENTKIADAKDQGRVAPISCVEQLKIRIMLRSVSHSENW